MSIIIGDIDKFKKQLEFDKNINNKKSTITGIDKSGISDINGKLLKDSKKSKSDSNSFESELQEALEQYKQGKK